MRFSTSTPTLCMAADMNTPLRILAGLFVMLCCSSQAAADTQAEYRLKAAFLYNFVAFTEWPADVANTLNVCVYGPDPFGEELDKYRGKNVAGRSLAMRRVNSVDNLGSCQVVFVARPVIGNLARVLDSLSGSPVLIVADSPGAARQGAAINMSAEQSKVTFEANLAAARRNRLNLSSKLLRLASEVLQ